MSLSDVCHFLAQDGMEVCLPSSRLHLPPGCRGLQGPGVGEPQMGELETLIHQEEKNCGVDEDTPHWAAMRV